MNTFPPGTLVDERYNILEHLSSGGMGTVYRATELEIQRTVALKFLQPELLCDMDSRARFRREGKALSKLSHPGIVTFYRFGLWQKSVVEVVPYIAMEFVKGQSLRSVLDEAGQLPVRQALDIAAGVCEAIAHAHSHGVIHRDLKPGNLLLTVDDGIESVKVLDFGLVRSVVSSVQSQQLTDAGALIGSVYYMSPEQCKGAPAAESSDIYSLGCVLYEMLAGEPPYTADAAIGVIHKHVNEELKPLEGSESLPGIQALIDKATAKTPSMRYASMDRFLADIRLVQSGDGRRLGTLSSHRAVRLPSFAIAGLVLLVVAAAGLTLYVVRTDSPIGLQSRSLDDIATAEEELVKAQLRFERARARHEDVDYETAVLHEKVAKLQRALWDAGRRPEAVRLYDKRLQLLEDSSVCYSQRVNVMCDMMSRCFDVLCATNSKRERAKFIDLFNDALRRADAYSDKADQFAMANLLSWHCVDDLCARNFEQAVVDLGKMLGALGKNGYLMRVNDMLGTKSYELSERQRLCFDTVLHPLVFQRVREQKLRPDQFFLLEEYLLRIQSTPVARKAKSFPSCIRYCRALVQESFKEPPKEPSLRKRYDDVLTRIRQAELQVQPEPE